MYFTTLLQAEKKKVEPDKPKDAKPKKKLIGECVCVVVVVVVVCVGGG